MKTAKQWCDELEYAELEAWNYIITLEQIAVIQADALRHAAQLVRGRGGDNEDYHAKPIEDAALECS